MKNNEEISESSINSTLAKTIYLVAANGKVEKSSSTKISFSSYEKMVLPSPTTPIPQMAQTAQVFRKSGTSV